MRFPVAAGLPAQAAARRQPAALPAGRRQVPALPVQQQDQRWGPSPTCPCSRGRAGSVPGLCAFAVVTTILSRLFLVVQASWRTRWAWARPSRPSASSCCSWSAKTITGPTSSLPPRQAYAMLCIIVAPLSSNIRRDHANRPPQSPVNRIRFRSNGSKTGRPSCQCFSDNKGPI